MIKEAEQFAEQDKKKREEAELRNNADSIIYTAEKTKKDLAEKLTADQTGKIDTAITALKDALASNDMAKVKEKSDALTKVLQEIGTFIYQQAAEQAKQQQAQTGSQAGPQSPPPGGENVVDSNDYKVK